MNRQDDMWIARQDILKTTSLRPRATQLCDLVARHSGRLLRLIIILMAAVATLKLGSEFWRLLLSSGTNAAVDLYYRLQEVQDWFHGDPTFLKPNLDYPPATYALLYPFVGWLSFASARLLWCAITLAALWWAALLAVRESGAETRLEKIFVLLLPLSLNGTGVAIGNGQMSLQVLTLMLASLLMLRREPPALWRDIALASLAAASLAKPNVTAPFFWLVMFASNRLRPAVLAVAAYTALTIFAASFKDINPLSLFHALADGSARAARVGARVAGYGDVHTWLSTRGLAWWNAPASLLILTLLGGWVYRHRRGDLWVLIGVTALVARFWAYHRVYDDVLILLAEVALFRIAKGISITTAVSETTRLTSAVLLGVCAFLMLAPSSLLQPPAFWSWLLAGSRVGVWLAMLIFLLRQAGNRDHCAGSA